MGDPEYRTMRSRVRGDGRGARAGGSWTGCNGIGHRMSYANSGVGHWMSDGGKTETRGTLFTLEVAHSKLVAVAIDWQQIGGWGQAGRLAMDGAWGMAPQTNAKAPSRGF